MLVGRVLEVSPVPMFDCRLGLGRRQSVWMVFFFLEKRIRHLPYSALSVVWVLGYQRCRYFVPLIMVPWVRVWLD